ncbi:solute carrier organic anion transporter family member 2A1 [Biomphalaria glabrata]|nr:solute carrier organic anion transporter family member 2A1-like; partial [Biomphalaria glabrata]
MSGPLGTELNGFLTEIPIDLKKTDMDTKDGRFVAAWWLAFLVCGAGLVVTSFPLLLFPKSLVSEKDKLRALRRAYTGGVLEEKEEKPSTSEKKSSVPKIVLEVEGQGSKDITDHTDRSNGHPNHEYERKGSVQSVNVPMIRKNLYIICPQDDLHIICPPDDLYIICPPDDLHIICPQDYLHIICPPDYLYILCPPDDLHIICPQDYLHIICPQDDLHIIYPQDDLHIICPPDDLHIICPPDDLHIICPPDDLHIICPPDDLYIICPQDYLHTICPQDDLYIICPSDDLHIICPPDYLYILCPPDDLHIICPQDYLHIICPQDDLHIIYPQDDLHIICPPDDLHIICPPDDLHIICPPDDLYIICPQDYLHTICPQDDLHIICPPDDLYIICPPDDLYIIFPPDDLYIICPSEDLYIISPPDDLISSAHRMTFMLSLFPPLEGPTERKVSLSGEIVFDQPLSPKVDENQNESTLIELIKDLPRSFLRLIKTPMFVLIIIDICAISMPLSGMYMFRNIYITMEYNVPMSEVAMATSVTSAVGTAGGTILSTWLASKAKSKLALQWIIMGTYLIQVAVNPLFLIFGCDNKSVYGASGSIGLPINLTAGCDCSNSKQLLSCGDDGNNYLSPCHAGCTGVDGKIFTDCQGLVNSSFGTSVTPGLCSTDCHDNFLLYVILHGVQYLVESGTMIPRWLLMLRIVEPQDRGFATSFFIFFYNIMSIPSSNVFGQFIDNACFIWDGQVCNLYNRDSIRYLMSGIDVGVNVLSIMTNLPMLIILRLELKKTKRDNENDDESKNKEKKAKEDIKDNSNLQAEIYTY